MASYYWPPQGSGSGSAIWGSITGNINSQSDLQAEFALYVPLTSGVTGSGANGQVSFWTGAQTQAGSNNLWWDNSNFRLGILGNAPTHSLTLSQGAAAAIYNTSDQTTNYQRFTASYISNVLTMVTGFGGSSTAQAIQLGVASTAGNTTPQRTFQIQASPVSSQGIFDFNNGSTGLTGATMSIQGTYTSSSGTVYNQAQWPTVNQTGTGAYNLLYMSPYLQGTGSGTSYLVNIGTNSAAQNSGTHSPVFTMTSVGLAFIAYRLGIGNTATSSTLQLASNNSTATVFSTAGLVFQASASTLTSTGSSGTITTGAANSFNSTTMAASSATTLTNAVNLYVDVPVAGTNLTFTNTYAAYFNGSTYVNGVLGAQTGFYIGSSGTGGVLSINKNRSGTTLGITGTALDVAPGTGNSTDATGTYANINTVSVKAQTLTATNTVTYTNAASFYIDNAPIAGSNVTITNALALFVNNGLSAFQGNISTSASLGSNANMTVIGTNAIGSSGNAPVLFAGAGNVNYRSIFTGSSASSTLTTAYSASNIIVGSGLFTTAASGTHALLANLVVNPLGTITSGGATVTNTASLYVQAAGSGGTNNWALLVNSGNSSFGGTVAGTNFIDGYTTTATAAGTTTLTVSSTYQQYFTGSTTQTVVLPVATTLVNGQSFEIVNNSTGVVTVQTSGSNVIQAMAAGTQLIVTCINTAGGTGTASWSSVYTKVSPITKVVIQNFTSSGTYTPTTGMVYCQIEVIGGGGGGGGAAGNASDGAAGGGGGGGGYGRQVFTAATIGASQTVTVGAAGGGASAGPNTGGTGGTTSVGALISATGGVGGTGGTAVTGSSTNAGGAGGSSSATYNVTGNSGGNGFASTTGVVSIGGNGGNCYGVGGSVSVYINNTGAAATAAGGGGGGGCQVLSATSYAGGAGFAGEVIITEYISA